MELRIEPYKAPDQILFNYDELKAALVEKCSVYETMVYTDDQIRDAKADRANLNRLKKALNDERIKREREYMESFNVFKGQIAEICGIIDKSVVAVDMQVKAFEEQQKEKKLEEIKNVWEELLMADEIPSGITFEHIFEEKWLNATVKIPAIKKAIIERLEQIIKDLTVIENLPSYTFEAKEVYINTLDLGKAITEANRLREVAEKKAAWEAEQEQKKAEPKQPEAVNYGSSKSETPVNEPSRQWIGFQAFLSVDEAKALGQYMKSHGIQYKAI